MKSAKKSTKARFIIEQEGESNEFFSSLSLMKMPYQNFEGRQIYQMKFSKLETQLLSENWEEVEIALEELASALAMAEERMLIGLDFGNGVKKMVECLETQQSQNILINASACLMHLLDINPGIARNIVKANGVRVLCNKISMCELPDLSENSINCVHKISFDYGDMVLYANALPILFNILDFQITSVQKTILTTIVNVFKFVRTTSSLENYIIPCYQSFSQFLYSLDEQRISIFLQCSCGILSLITPSKSILKILYPDEIIQQLFSNISSDQYQKLFFILTHISKSKHIASYLLSLNLTISHHSLEILFEQLFNQEEKKEFKEAQLTALKLLATMGETLAEKEVKIEVKNKWIKLCEFILPIIFGKQFQADKVGELMHWMMVIGSDKKEEIKEIFLKEKTKIVNFFAKMSGCTNLDTVLQLLELANELCKEDELCLRQTILKGMQRQGVKEWLDKLVNGQIQLESQAKNKILKLGDRYKYLINKLNEPILEFKTLQDLKEEDNKNESEQLEELLKRDFFFMQKKVKKSLEEKKKGDKEKIVEEPKKKEEEEEEEEEEEKEKDWSKLFILPSLEKSPVMEIEQTSPPQFLKQFQDSNPPNEKIELSELQPIEEIESPKMKKVKSLANKILEYMKLYDFKQDSILNDLNFIIEEIQNYLEIKQFGPESNKIISLVDKLCQLFKNYSRITVFEAESTSFFEKLTRLFLSESEGINLNVTLHFMFMFARTKIDGNSTLLQEFLLNLVDIFNNWYDQQKQKDNKEPKSQQSKYEKLLQAEENIKYLATTAQIKIYQEKNDQLREKINEKKGMTENLEIFDKVNDYFKQYNMFLLSIDNLITLDQLKDQILSALTMRLRTQKKTNLSFFSKSKSFFLQEKAKQFNTIDKFDLPFDMLQTKGEEQKELLQGRVIQFDKKKENSRSRSKSRSREQSLEKNKESKAIEPLEIEQKQQGKKEQRKAKRLEQKKQKMEEKKQQKQEHEDKKLVGMFNPIKNFKKYFDLEIIHGNPPKALTHEASFVKIINEWKKTRLVRSGNLYSQFSQPVEIDLHIKIVEKKVYSVEVPKTPSSSVLLYEQLFATELLQELATLLKKLDQHCLKQTQKIPKQVIAVIKLINLCNSLNEIILPILKHLDSFIPQELSSNFPSPISENNKFYNKQLLQNAVHHQVHPLSHFKSIIFGELALEDQLVYQFLSFTIPFASRKEFFKLNAFGLQRLIYMFNDDYLQFRGYLNQIKKKKVTLIRNTEFEQSTPRLLESTIKMARELINRQAILDFDFEEEPAVGLGPTLESYSLWAQEFTNSRLNLFRENINTSEGLFPQPYIPSTNKLEDQKFLFKLLGAITARAIIDERILNLPLNTVFWSLLLDRPITLSDIQSLDKEFYSSIIQLYNLTCDNNSNEIIDSLCLEFILPGHPIHKLSNITNEKYVSSKTLLNYLNNLVQTYIFKSIAPQLHYFKLGFSFLIDLEALKYFPSNEINQLFAGENQEPWDIETLYQQIVPSYGYTNKSQVFVWLLEILAEFDFNEQASFLQFVTGCPRLPYGGFKALHPKITVVKKTEAFYSATIDQVLPSVMTCQNYLKLPEYSQKVFLKQKLSQAMVEGQNNFSLS